MLVRTPSTPLGARSKAGEAVLITDLTIRLATGAAHTGGVSHVDPPWPDERVPRGIAELIRPHIATVAVDIAGEIQAQIPEYARPADDNYNRAIRIGVEEALNQFVAVLDGEPGARHDTWREIYRALGAGEVREGRSLDSLQAALRVGAG